MTSTLSEPVNSSTSVRDTLEARQVDVDGKKFWLEFARDGEFIDDEIISVAGGNTTGSTWEVELDDI
jgi:predicted transcriptional regulator